MNLSKVCINTSLNPVQIPFLVNTKIDKYLAYSTTTLVFHYLYSMLYFALKSADFSIIIDEQKGALVSYSTDHRPSSKFHIINHLKLFL